MGDTEVLFAASLADDEGAAAARAPRLRTKRGATPRRRGCRVVVAALLLTLFPLSGAWAKGFATKAPYAFMIDYETGRVLLAKNADKSMSPASTTKILTAEIVFSKLAAGQLRLSDPIKISARAASEGAADAGGSSMFAQAGGEIRVEDLLRGLLIMSGNDAAVALAEGVAGSEEAFAVQMNRRARELGMAHSHFTNAWGEGSSGQRVTPRDMARLAAHVIRDYPQYYGYFGEREFTWNNIRQANRNPLLAMSLGADGMKTGHLGKSGFGLVGSATQGGHRLILVINGLRTDQDRASEARKLMQWGFGAISAR